VHVKLHVRLDGQMVFFTFLGDNKDKYLGSMMFKPPECQKYVEVKAFDLTFSGAERENAVNRVQQSRVYGNSLRTRHTEENKMAQFLLQEIHLVDYLKRLSPLFEEGNVVVRFTKGFVDYHDMDTASSIFLGDKEQLDSAVLDASVNTPETFLICTETRGLFDCADIRDVSEVMACIQERGIAVDKSIQLNHHLQKALEEMRPKRDDFPTHMLLTISNFDDVIQIGIPGGARNLGDTPLECAFKAAAEKAGIVLDPNGNLTIKDSPEACGGPNGSVMWELFLHSQNDINQYYFRVAGSGKVIGDAVDNDLIAAVKSVSISR
jgi:hypothetical protein